MRDTINIGSTGFAQVGSNDYWEKQKFEGKFLKSKTVELIGEPPEGSYLIWKGFPHDFGTYHELCLVMDDENDKHWNYMDKAEGIDMDGMEEEIELLWLQDHQEKIEPDDVRHPKFRETYMEGGDGQDPENLFNLGPTGHGPDICMSDADPGL